ncbi:MAG: TetR/AcrR family transcriptional regulator [Anaerolineaceae bacterium]|nr:TetR/AcrR family transcriptional regulator [Anaerolineaceae bacterium]
MGLREEKEHSTRLHIMETAYRLFCENGIEATEMLQIAKETKISRPTLYRYFESKHVLAETIYLWNLNKITSLNRDYSPAMTCYEIMELFFRTTLDALFNHPRWLVFDAIYNMYASRIHLDPTTIPSHPLNMNPHPLGDLIEDLDGKVNDGSIRSFRSGNDLIDSVIFPYFAYLQRLAIFSLQKEGSSWNETVRQAELLHDFYLRILKPSVK